MVPHTKFVSISLTALVVSVIVAVSAANNYYAGIGPATANSFRKMVGLKEVLWEEMKQKRL